MSELLLELFSEEIPARMQGRAAEDLRRLVVEACSHRASGRRGARLRDATPAGARRGRRAGRISRACPKRRKGPRVGAPEQAVAGISKAAGLEVSEAGRDRQGREEGRLLRRPPRQAGPPRRRDHRRNGPGRARQVPLAEVHALGQRHRSVGAPAAFHPLPARRQGRALRLGRRVERQHHARPPLPRQRAVRREKLRRLREAAGKAQGPPRRPRPRRRHRRPGPGACQGCQAAPRRGRGADRRERRPHRMARRLHGRVRQVLPVGARRVPDDVDEDAPEVLLPARCPLQEARQQVPRRLEPDAEGRRHRHRPGQREGHPRPPVRRQVLLGAGPEAAPASPCTSS